VFQFASARRSSDFAGGRELLATAGGFVMAGNSTRESTADRMQMRDSHARTFLLLSTYRLVPTSGSIIEEVSLAGWRMTLYSLKRTTSKYLPLTRSPPAQK
jgi:hypothetical protein